VWTVVIQKAANCKIRHDPVLIVGDLISSGKLPYEGWLASSSVMCYPYPQGHLELVLPDFMERCLRFKVCFPSRLGLPLSGC